MAFRAGLLQLPPSIRTSIYANAASIRSFSSTPQRKVDASDLTKAFVAAPTALFDGIHAIGIPWIAAIPLTAIVVRGVVGYYVAARPTRLRGLARINLFPITNARIKVRWAEHEAREQERMNQGGLRMGKLTRPITFGLLRLREAAKVGKEFGAPLFTWHNWINFAGLITFSEAVRIKCGTEEGLLSLLLRPFASGEKATATLDPAEALADRILAQREALQSQVCTSDTFPDGNALAEQYQLLSPSPSVPSAYADLVDPTLKVEGLAWLQDLTAPDPTIILPTALFVVMAANLIFRPKPRQGADSFDSFQQRLKDLGGTTTLAEDQTATTMREAKSSTNARHQQQSQQETATNDVLHAMQVADSLNKDLMKKRKAKNPGSAFGIRRLIGLAFSGLFFMVAQGMPAALVLYVTTSMLTAWLQGRWLDVKYPMGEPIRPCRRPIRYKIRQEYGESSN